MKHTGIRVRVPNCLALAVDLGDGETGNHPMTIWGQCPMDDG